MKTRTIRLTTTRLVMKSLKECDRENLLRMAADERVKKTYMMPDFADQAKADAFFDGLRTLSASEGRFVYGIYLDGRLIGFLNDCGIEGKAVELGYFVDPEYWNRGYATEALTAAIKELFRMGYEYVTAGYFAENPASRRVMEKCGMQPLAHETAIEYRGVPHRCLYCGIACQD